MEEHKTFKGFIDSGGFLDRSQFFNILEGKMTSAVLPKIWKKSFNNGKIIPTKMRFCNECNDKRMCNRCNNQTDEIEEL